jgi:uncharacterized protein YndB with AHSA1/START domain
MQEIDLDAQVSAPPEAVWRVYTDSAGWPRWAGVKEVVLRQAGDPPPDGLGAIRVIRSRGIAIEEEVTAFDPPKRVAYRMVAGLPVRDFCGEVCFGAADGGTRIRWTVRFRARVPGTGPLLRRLVARMLGDVLERLNSQEVLAREEY